jgi:hypothetical protein
MIEIEVLAKRVETLERQNGWLKLAVLVGSLVVMVVIFSGADKAQKTIEAEKIVLLDRDGHAKLTIGTPALTGATVGVNPDDPVVWLTDETGADRAMLTTEGLFFADRKIKPTISLSSDPKGASRIRIYGSDGKLSWSAP